MAGLIVFWVVIAGFGSVFADHIADLIAGKTVFIIEADLPSAESMQRAEVKGYQSKDDPNQIGYIVTITKRSRPINSSTQPAVADQIQEIQYRVPFIRGTNPIQTALTNGLLNDFISPKRIATKEKNLGIDPCWEQHNSFSMWIRQDDEMVKVETGHCGGKAPFVTPVDQNDLRLLNVVRDALLAMTIIEKE